MTTRINNGSNEYLYCSVSTEVSQYQDMYDSSEECIEDIKADIIEDCESRGYSDIDAQKVIGYYETLFHNANGKWINLYK